MKKPIQITSIEDKINLLPTQTEEQKAETRKILAKMGLSAAQIKVMVPEEPATNRQA